MAGQWPRQHVSRLHRSTTALSLTPSLSLPRGAEFTVSANTFVDCENHAFKKAWEWIHKLKFNLIFFFFAHNSNCMWILWYFSAALGHKLRELRPSPSVWKQRSGWRLALVLVIRWKVVNRQGQRGVRGFPLVCSKRSPIGRWKNLLIVSLFVRRVRKWDDLMFKRFTFKQGALQTTIPRNGSGKRAQRYGQETESQIFFLSQKNYLWLLTFFLLFFK